MKLVILYIGLLAGLLVLIFTDRQKKTPAPVEPEKYEVVLRMSGFVTQHAADEYRNRWLEDNQNLSFEGLQMSGFSAPEGVIA